MAQNSSTSQLVQAYDPGFLCKDNATKIWKDLTIEGLSIHTKWIECKFMNQYFNNQAFLSFGENLLNILRSPDLTIPALIKEDNNVDFHSVYSQYLYEYLFRMKSIYAGKKPAATFTFLSERELLDFSSAISSSSLNNIAEEIKFNDESQMFLRLRWYCSSPKFSSNYDSSLGSTWFTTSQLTEAIKPTEASSSLLSLVTLIHDTVTFH